MTKKIITSLFLVFAYLYSYPQQKVKVNAILVDSSFDEPTLKKLDEAIKLLDSAFNSDEFAKRVLATKFNVGNFNLSSTQILQIIMSGMDSIANKPRDYSIDLRLAVYDVYKGGNEFGNTGMSGSKIHITETHRCYILQNDVKCYASHLAHEYLHEIGFYDEKTWFLGKKSKSVPYKIGNIINDIIKNTSHCAAINATCQKH